jgi:long-chain-acyl-CoA dehydrogenase
MEAEELELFRTSARRFMEREIVPNCARWRAEGMVDKALWHRAGEAGLLLAGIPEAYGGGGGNFRHEAVIIEELARINFLDFGAALHSAIVAPYILHYGTDEQKHRWLPRLASGELIGAIAMTEPAAGSDLRGIRTSARREGDAYILNGQKVFITNGQLANLIIVVAKTDPTAGGRGMSLVCVETDHVEGFRRGRNLEKVGFKAQDTSELFFDDVRVPANNVIGGEINNGFRQLKEQLPQERLIVAIQAVGAIEAAIEMTLAYTKERQAFGKAILDFQNTRFKMAEAATEARVARVFINFCIEELVAGRLDDVTGAMAKWWTTQKQCEIIDECLQLFGGYGYMAEYPIATLWTDARVQKIYGGTNEIMKEIIGRSLTSADDR